MALFANKITGSSDSNVDNYVSWENPRSSLVQDQCVLLQERLSPKLENYVILIAEFIDRGTMLKLRLVNKQLCQRVTNHNIFWLEPSIFCSIELIFLQVQIMPRNPEAFFLYKKV